MSPSGELRVPRIVCLCGSTRWPGLHLKIQAQETMAGSIVIPLGAYGHADIPPGTRRATDDGDESNAVKQRLDELHFRKIDLADEVIAVRVDGYVGSSTAREVRHARMANKLVRWADYTRKHAEAVNVQIFGRSLEPEGGAP